MANRILEKNIFYNSISEQHLSFANQLTVHSWNDIINMLKYQANANAYYLEHLHKWLVGDDSAVTPEDFPNLLEYINYINDRFKGYYTKVQFNQVLSDYYTKAIVDGKLQQLSTDLNNLHGQLITRLSTKAETSWVEQRLSTKENKAHISDTSPNPTQTDVWLDTSDTEQQTNTSSFNNDYGNHLTETNTLSLLNDEESLLLDDTENVIINEEDRLLSDI